MMRKRIAVRTLVLSLACLLGLQTAGLAAQTSFSYVYNSRDESVPTAVAYEPERVITGNSLGAGDLQKPRDMMVFGERVYVLDSDNQRILRLTATGTLEAEIRPTTPEGEALAFGEAVGLCVTADRLYVADKAGKLVYVLDHSGKMTGTIASPDAAVLPPGFYYEPTKVLVSSKGYVYVISANTTAGALLFDPELRFLGFFGSEKVAVDEQMMLDNLWRKILNPKQVTTALERRVPVPFTNFVIDAEDYIYTIRSTGGGRQQVRKLNAQGNNILFTQSGLWGMFSERETWFDKQNNVYVDSLLIDITVDSDGFITVLDSNRGRVFQYDQQSNHLFTFGGKAKQDGTFRSPVALDHIGDRLLILDQEAGSVTVMKPTQFAKDVRTATLLYQDGLYVQAQPYWERVLKMDGNYELANIGMAKACTKLERHEEALDYYKRGNDATGYSNAAKILRDAKIRDYFGWILIGVVALIGGLVAWLLYSERHRRSEYAVTISRGRYPAYCLLHPFKGYTGLKFEKQGSLAIANGILIVWFLVDVLNRQLTGFHFNANNTEQFNLLLELARTVGLFAAWVVCNWAVSTFTDGEGKLREIWIFTAYALLPLVLTLAVTAVFSNFFSLQERAFYDIVQTIGMLWFLISGFMSVREVHQYSTKQTVFHLILTFVGIAFIVLIVSAVYSMFVQLFSFVIMLGNELKMR